MPDVAVDLTPSYNTIPYFRIPLNISIFEEKMAKLLKKPLKLALVQLATGPDKTANLARARSKVLEAASNGANLVGKRQLIAPKQISFRSLTG